MKMRKAYGYTRVSSVGQEDKDGPVRQRKAIEKCAAEKGMRIVRWFEDGISGTKMNTAPQFHQMINELVANGVRIVLFEKLERLAGLLVLQEQILLDFENMKVEAISAVGEDLSSKDPNRVLQRQMLGAFNQYRRAMIFAQTQAAKARKRATDPNYREGRHPYGRDSQEQATIKHILELRASGMTLTAIANKLMEEGILTRDGLKVWQPRTVLVIINRAKLTP